MILRVFYARIGMFLIKIETQLTIHNSSLKPNIDHHITSSALLLIITTCPKGARQPHTYTEDGSVNAVPQILYGQYLILGAFGSYML